MADNELSIVLTLDNGQFQSNLTSSKQSLDEIGESGSLSAGKIAEGFLLAEIAIEGIKKGFEVLKEQFFESINAAMAHDQALTSMNLALSNAGIYSVESSNGMREFAEEMSKASNYSASMIMQTESLAINFAKTEDGAKRLTQAALDLSAATGKDVNTSLRILGQSMNGVTYGLDKLLPGLKSLSEEELRAGAAADIIIARFGGTLQAQTETFAGRLAQLRKAFEEVHEKMGNVITQSPIVNRAIEGLTILIESVTKKIEEWAKTGGFESLLKNLIQLSDGFITYVVRPLELVTNVGKFVFIELAAGVDGFIMIVAKVAEAIVNGITKPLLDVVDTAAKVISYFNKDFADGIHQGIEKVSKSITGFTSTFSKSSEDAFKEASAKGGEAMRSMFDTPIADKMGTKLAEIRTFFDGAHAPINGVKENVQQMGVAAVTVGGAFHSMSAGMAAEARRLRDSAGKDFEQLGKQMINTMGHGAASAFSAFGHALATGENALQAFTSALLKALGEAAVQMGTQFMLKGIAYMFDPMTMEFGPPLIAAGAALATFGGVLSGVGGGAAPVSGGVGASGGSAGGLGGAQPVQTTQPQVQKQAQIIVNGDFLNSRETANHLAEVLRQNSDVTDYTITAQGRSYI